MDVIKSRYGKDRSIEKLGDKRIRVMGESNFTKSQTDEGVVTMFDFEGGHLQRWWNDKTSKNYKVEN